MFLFRKIYGIDYYTDFFYLMNFSHFRNSNNRFYRHDASNRNMTFSSKDAFISSSKTKANRGFYRQVALEGTKERSLAETTRQ